MERIDLGSDCAVTESSQFDLIALDEALARLAVEEPVKAELVKLRFFAGLTMPEAADALGVSLATQACHPPETEDRRIAPPVWACVNTQ